MTFIIRVSIKDLKKPLNTKFLNYKIFAISEIFGPVWAKTVAISETFGPVKAKTVAISQIFGPV